MKATLDQLNRGTADEFVAVCGPLFEHSPWIARRAAEFRPFDSIEQLHDKLCQTMMSASVDEKIGLIATHPDLVGRLAREGRLTSESTAEQAAAGLSALTPDEVDLFERCNAAYRERFGFPFVICAREHKKSAILQAFPIRLQNTRDQEIAAALVEIGKIARLRLLDAVGEV